MNTWKRPDYYGGFNPDGDYVLLWQHRDSELLDRHNWNEACERLSAEAYDGGNDEFETRPAVYHWRAGHWVVGWVEYLMVRADAPESVIAVAQEIADSLADYPILNETAYSDLEFNEVCDYWERCSVRDRVDAIHASRAHVSVFAARRDYLPQDDCGALFDYLRAGL